MVALLKWVGAIWAGLGFLNIVASCASPQTSDTVQMWGIIFNGFIFIVPGLVLVGISHLMERRQQTEGLDDGERHPCPQCAELIMAAARKCRFCGCEIKPTKPPLWES